MTADTQTLSSLGTVDFSVVEDFVALPAQRYPGQTAGWEAKPAKDGKSTNVVTKVVIQYEKTDDEGETVIKNRTLTTYYNLKPEAMWRIKRDLIALGADPALLKTRNVNLEALLNQYFGSTPTPIWAHLVQEPFTPEGETEPQLTNKVSKIEIRESN